MGDIRLEISVWQGVVQILSKTLVGGAFVLKASSRVFYARAIYLRSQVLPGSHMGGF